jgi:hypothetical protein
MISSRQTLKSDVFACDNTRDVWVHRLLWSGVYWGYHAGALTFAGEGTSKDDLIMALCYVF